MSKHKLLSFEPTPEMVRAAEDAYMPFGDMDLALRMAILAAPAVQKPAPDVSGLVEALEQVIKAAPSGGPLWHGSEQIVEARAALAAYRKGGEA